MSKGFIASVLIIGVLILAVFLLLADDMKLRHRMEEAATEIKLHELDKRLSNQAALNQREGENAIRETRESTNRRLEDGACLVGDDRIDHLLRLLDEDYKNRCGKTAGSVAN